MNNWIELDRLSLSGGFSKLSGLAQRLADICELPCYVSLDHEATLRGAAFLAAGQPDNWHADQPHIYFPQPNRNLVQRFQLWREATSSLI